MGGNNPEMQKPLETMFLDVDSLFSGKLSFGFTSTWCPRQHSKCTTEQMYSEQLAALDFRNNVLNSLCRCKDDLDRAPAEFTRARLEDVHALVYFDQSLATKLRAQNLFLNKFFLMTECHKRFGPLLQRLLPFLYKSPENPVGGGPAATEEFTGAKLRAMRRTWSAVVFLVGAAALGGAVASGRSFLLKSR